MTLNPIQTDLVYSGIIEAASSATPGRDHTYTVRINALQLSFQNVSPQRQLRWQTLSPDLDLVPFLIGTRVAVHVINAGNGYEAIIETSELPAIGECP